MGWEQFIKHNRNREMATFSPHGIYLSKALKFGHPMTYAEIYVDEDANKIGIKPSDEGFKLTQVGLVPCRSLITKYSIKPQRIKATWDNNLGMIIMSIQLKEASQ